MGSVIDILIIFSTVIIIILGLTALFKGHIKLWKRIALAAFLLIFTGLSIAQYFINQKEKNDGNATIKNLQDTVNTINDRVAKLQEINQSLTEKDREFKNALFSQFKIAWDSVTNKPIVYNNSFERVGTVNIGR